MSWYETLNKTFFCITDLLEYSLTHLLMCSVKCSENSYSLASLEEISDVKNFKMLTVFV